MKRTLLVIATILLIAGYVWLIGVLIEAGQPVKHGDWFEGEKHWIEQRMTYHGIWGCEGYNGKYHFYRNGRRCEL